MPKNSYTKKELAQLYNISSRTITNFLNRGTLYDLLIKNGYLKYQKILQPKLISIVFEYLGSPF